MQQNTRTLSQAQSGLVIQTNSVIRNTYILLSMTLMFSAITGWFGMVSNARPIGIIALVVYFGLLYATQALRNSVWGLVSIFALTGFLGYTLGPLLNRVVYGFTNGPQLVMSAFGLTGLTFLVLSGYALTTRTDFNYLVGFLFVGGMVAMVASIAAIFFQVPMLYLTSCSAFVLISSGAILFETSQIIHGGERNYIMATVSLYVSIFNLFVSLLQLLAAFAGRRD